MKYIIALLFSFIAVASFGQKAGSTDRPTEYIGQLWADSLIRNALYDTTHAPKVKGGMFYSTSDSTLYVYNGFYWQSAATSKVNSIITVLNVNSNTIYVTNNLSIPDIDTNSVVNPSIGKTIDVEPNDKNLYLYVASSGAKWKCLSCSVATTLQNAITADNKLYKNDTINAQGNNLLFSSIGAFILSTSAGTTVTGGSGVYDITTNDSINLNSSGITTITGNLKFTNLPTNGSPTYTVVTDGSGNAGKIAYSSGGGGGVSSVGTGYGLTGGPITTTGTIVADTTKLIPYTDTLKNYGIASQSYVNSHISAAKSLHAVTYNGDTTSAGAKFYSASDSVIISGVNNLWYYSPSGATGAGILTPSVAFYPSDGSYQTTLFAQHASGNNTVLLPPTSGTLALTTATISGVALNGNLFNLTNGYGIASLSYNGSSATTVIADTTKLIPYTDTLKNYGIATQSYVNSKTSAGYVPYTGATGTVNLGTNNVSFNQGTANSINFLPLWTTATPNPTHGNTQFDSAGLNYLDSSGKMFTLTKALIPANTRVRDSLPNESGVFILNRDTAAMLSPYKSVILTVPGSSFTGASYNNAALSGKAVLVYYNNVNKFLNSGSDFTNIGGGGFTLNFSPVSTDSFYVFSPQGVSPVSSTNSPVQINTQSGTTYTLVTGDLGKTINFTNSAAIAVTIPSGLGLGFNCIMVQSGTGQITVSASGSTLHSYQGSLTSAGQYAQINVVPTSTDTYNIGGNLQ